MPTARRRLSPEDRRAELLALGAEVFGKRPYDEVRIDEIAERAGVSRALMYHYFPDKRAFFAAVVKDEADRLYEATNNAPAVRPDDVRRDPDGCAGLHGLPRAESGGRVGGLRRPRPVRPGSARHRRRSQEPPDGTHHDPHRRGRARRIPGKSAGPGCRARPAGDHSTAGSRSPSRCAGSASWTPRPTPNGSPTPARTRCWTRSPGCPRFPTNWPTRPWRPHVTQPQ